MQNFAILKITLTFSSGTRINDQSDQLFYQFIIDGLYRGRAWRIHQHF
jgi:hypothetical protein